MMSLILDNILNGIYNPIELTRWFLTMEKEEE